MGARFFAYCARLVANQAAVADKLIVLATLCTVGFNLYTAVPALVSLIFAILPVIARWWAFRRYRYRETGATFVSDVSVFAREFVGVTVDGKPARYDVYQTYHIVEDKNWPKLVGAGTTALVEFRRAAVVITAASCEFFAETEEYARTLVKAPVDAPAAEVLRVFPLLSPKGEHEGYCDRPTDSRVLFDPSIYPCYSEIVAALDRWVANRARHALLGSTRLGFLFHGPPGTGKSSLAKAIARHLNFRRICEGAVGADRVYVAEGERVVVVFDDIDILLAHDRAESPAPGSAQARVFDSLMKYLDGDANQDSVIVFTTNYPERFDAALFRPGRIDYTIALAPLPPANVAAFARRFYGVDPLPAGFEASLAPMRVCEVCNVARRHIDSFEDFAAGALAFARGAYPPA